MRKSGLLSLLAFAFMSCTTIQERKLDEIDFPPQRLIVSAYEGGINISRDFNNDKEPDREYPYRIAPFKLDKEKLKANPNFSDISYIFTYDGKKISPLFGKLLFKGYYSEGMVFLGDYDGDGKFNDKHYYKFSDPTDPGSFLYFLTYHKSEPYIRNSTN